jgi:hypothetical protein
MVGKPNVGNAKKFKIVNNKVIRLTDGEDKGERFNPAVKRACRRLRHLRVALGVAIYRRREKQHEAAARRAKKVMKRNARARRKGQDPTYLTKRPSPLKQVWTQDTIMDEYDNTDPWTPEPGESVLYSDYRPASSDDDMDEYNLVMWDAIEQDPAMLLDEGFCLEADQALEQTPTLLQPCLPQEALGLETAALATVSRKGETDDEEEPERPSKEHRISPEPSEKNHIPQAAHVRESLNPYISPPSSQAELHPLRASPPPHDSTTCSKKRKASEDLEENPTKKRRESLTAYGFSEQITSALSEQTQPEASGNASSPLNTSSPQPASAPSSKKRKAGDDIDETPAKRQRDSPEPGEQAVSPEVVSSGANPQDLVNNSSPLGSPTVDPVDKQRKGQRVEQSTCPALSGPFTDASPAQSSLTNIHQPDPNLPLAGLASVIIQETTPFHNAARPLSTGPSSVNFYGDNQQTGKAPPSRIWFRPGWSCNLH